MNMKHIFAAVCLVCAAHLQAEDNLQYLYWQVDLTTDNPYEVPEFTYATVSLDGNRLSFYNTSGESLGTEMAIDGYKSLGDVGQVAGPLYAGVNAGITSGSFVFELWHEDTSGEAKLVGWNTYNYKQLLDSNAFYSQGLAGGGAAPLRVAAVPEPSSAFLLLFGIAGLALRRRKAALSVIVAATLHLGVFAGGADNLLYTVARNGVDTYADGTQVLDNEYYALVFLPKGSVGVEFAADCTVVDAASGEIVKVQRSGKSGNPIGFQVDSTVVDRCKGKGSWAVYVLDTRTYGESGVASVAPANDAGRPTCVNASKKLENTDLVVAASSTPVMKTAKGQVADLPTAVPADAPQPEITGVEVVDGKVHVKVSRTVPYLQYNLAAGASPDAVSGKAAESPRNGVQGDEIELVAPASGGSGFFRVNRN